jgi:uroporphyrinogen-III synthase
MTDAGPLEGRTIGITADRRWQEQADLFTKRGAVVMHGPTMRTMDLSRDEGLRSVTAELVARPPAYLIATTGMGMRWWLAAAADWGLAAPLLDGLARARVIARGAKSASAVRGAGLEVWWQAPSERMDDIVDRLAAEDATGERVALQLFEPAGHPSTDALRALSGELIELPVYRWLLPEDPGPAQHLISATIEGRVDAVTFTSQPAVHQLFRLAADMGGNAESGLRDALNGPVLAACVGPVCAEAAVTEGVTESVWPDPPRLVGLVKLVAERLGRS